MKNIFQYSFWVSLFFLVVSCDKGFDDLNQNQVSPTAVNPVFLLNNAVIGSAYNANAVIYEIGVVQQIITPNSGVLTGANFNQDNRAASQAMWQQLYRNVVRNVVDVIDQAKDLPNRSNLLNMARIWRAFTFMMLTDTYGDIPYTDGGKGFTSQILFPKYDPQQSIYTDIIKELTEATAALDTNKPIETADILYSGNISQWKRLGNSLLLRAGMRLTRANPTLAREVVVLAFGGGVINNNSDNAVIRHDANYVNPLGALLNGTEANNFYLAQPFVDYLKNTNDPRLRSIAVRYIGARSGPEQNPDRASIEPMAQVGMPLGFDNSTILAVASSLGLASFYEFSQVDRTRMVKQTAPTLLVTAAQTHLLLAEAAHRGWIAVPAKEFYDNGINLNMQELAAYGSNTVIPADEITSYLSANPFNPNNALEQINTQYWVASFLKGPEAFANFRRSGFPVLTPNPFPGKDISGDFIRRLTYPNSEVSVNSTNVQEAVARQGADNMDTRVWWDK